MERETLRILELVNQLSLTEEQKTEVLGFFSSREKDLKTLEAINTSEVERMVHVMPIMTVVREDVANQQFSREKLQQSAPDTDEGYWCVPKVVD